VTEQPYLGSALLTSHEVGPRKGGLNIVHSIVPRRVTALAGDLLHVVETPTEPRNGTIILQPGWNIQTLLDTADSDRLAHCTALIAAELKRFNIDIAALSETRPANKGSLSEVGKGYTFFWKGLPPDEHRIHDVGFATRTTLLNKLPETLTAVSERLMTFRVPLAKNGYVTVLSTYAPTLPSDESSKNRFSTILSTRVSVLSHVRTRLCFWVTSMPEFIAIITSGTG